MKAKSRVNMCCFLSRFCSHSPLISFVSIIFISNINIFISTYFSILFSTWLTYFHYYEWYKLTFLSSFLLLFSMLLLPHNYVIFLPSPLRKTDPCIQVPTENRTLRIDLVDESLSTKGHLKGVTSRDLKESKIFKS